MRKKYKAAIIGCGLMGKKRAGAHPECQVVACFDPVPERARALAETMPGVQVASAWESCLEETNVDIAVVATPHKDLCRIALAAVHSGKHVLVEKPAAMSAGEIRPLILAAEKRGVCVKVGFNHRFHPALAKAKEMADGGEIGPLLFVRGRYGHGGRAGYDREWRANPQVSGGGEMIDQGMHLIDLSRWFLGEFTEISGFPTTYFWDMPVEDNVFLLLKTANGQAAWLHASWTEWKNLFSFEIFGKNGKLSAEGLGGSYGTERLILHRMLPQMGPPETTIWEYPFQDRSFELEMEEFLNAIEERRLPSGNLYDAQAALEIVDRVYGKAR